MGKKGDGGARKCELSSMLALVADNSGRTARNKERETAEGKKLGSVIDALERVVGRMVKHVWEEGRRGGGRVSPTRVVSNDDWRRWSDFEERENGQIAHFLERSRRRNATH
ncbi:hypothetical protein Salat_1693100 [Sesamum alatum]|uniref:Uncharacterized protein n=1 Tax=Sesamum alatum TaxID=300844 RepID=A0AAE1Y7G7_9LAMI|nr:hypothetical protein Salat_1693100 [Sesamum alatum]